MADKTNRFEDNAPGPWYVDTACIGCGMCGEYAPSVFAEAAERDHHFVFRQPVTAEEINAAEEARQGCPVDAIGNDG